MLLSWRYIPHELMIIFVIYSPMTVVSPLPFIRSILTVIDPIFIYTQPNYYCIAGDFRIFALESYFVKNCTRENLFSVLNVAFKTS